MQLSIPLQFLFIGDEIQRQFYILPIPKSSKQTQIEMFSLQNRGNGKLKYVRTVVY